MAFLLSDRILPDVHHFVREDVAVALREAVDNSIAHAGLGKVFVMWTLESLRLTLEVVDEGRLHLGMMGPPSLREVYDWSGARRSGTGIGMRLIRSAMDEVYVRPVINDNGLIAGSRLVMFKELSSLPASLAKPGRTAAGSPLRSLEELKKAADAATTLRDLRNAYIGLNRALFKLSMGSGDEDIRRSYRKMAEIYALRSGFVEKLLNPTEKESLDYAGIETTSKSKLLKALVREEKDGAVMLSHEFIRDLKASGTESEIVALARAFMDRIYPLDEFYGLNHKSPVGVSSPVLPKPRDGATSSPLTREEVDAKGFKIGVKVTHGVYGQKRLAVVVEFEKEDKGIVIPFLADELDEIGLIVKPSASSPVRGKSGEDVLPDENRKSRDVIMAYLQLLAVGGEAEYHMAERALDEILSLQGEGGRVRGCWGTRPLLQRGSAAAP